MKLNKFSLLYALQLIGFVVMIYMFMKYGVSLSVVNTALFIFMLYVVKYAYTKYKFEDWIYYIFIAMLCGDFFGYCIKFYKIIPYYDKLLHIINPLVIFFVMSHFYKDKTDRTYFLIALSVIGICASWEIWEYFIDVLFGTTMQGVFDAAGKMMQSPIDDTMIDITLGAIGAFLGMFFMMKKFNNKGSIKV